MDFVALRIIKASTQRTRFDMQTLKMKLHSRRLVEKLSSQAAVERFRHVVGGQRLQMGIGSAVEDDGSPDIRKRQGKLGCGHSIVGQFVQSVHDVVSVVFVDLDDSLVDPLLHIADKMCRLSAETDGQRDELALSFETITLCQPALQPDKKARGENSQNGPYGLDPSRPIKSLTNDLNRYAHSANADTILAVAV